jgi:excisionase family DNA binding protein
MTKEPKVQRKFCTTREAAELLGVSLKTAQLWSESGLLEAWRTEGGHRRIFRTSVERLLVDNGSARANPAAEHKSNKDFHILVAEDEANLRKLYSIRLNSWRMSPQVTVVPNGFQALLKIGQKLPDLLITDLKMPEMDGFRMLQTLRELPDLESMAIVVVTGMDQVEIDAQGSLPADIRVFPKPIPFDAIENIAELLAAAKQTSKRASHP